MATTGEVLWFIVFLLGGIFGTVLGIVRFWICVGAGKLNADFGTKYRNKKFLKVVLHFIVCGILFYLAFRISAAH